MTLEFLLVHFPDKRTATANDGEVGFTNHLMLMSPDSYRIALSGNGYAPAFQDIQLSGTTAVSPLIVVFSATQAGDARAKKDMRRSNFGAALLGDDDVSALVGRALDPITWGGLSFNGFTRIDAWEELLDRWLFDHPTMAGLALCRPERNRHVLGEVFDFTPRRFDDICADFDDLPISAAVAASSAFPVALTPVNLQVFSGNCCPVAPLASIQRALGDPGSRFIDLKHYMDARCDNDLRHGDPEHQSRVSAPSTTCTSSVGGVAENLDGP